jgi:hypothetical protein
MRRITLADWPEPETQAVFWFWTNKGSFQIPQNVSTRKNYSEPRYWPINWYIPGSEDTIKGKNPTLTPLPLSVAALSSPPAIALRPVRNLATPLRFGNHEKAEGARFNQLHQIEM